MATQEAAPKIHGELLESKLGALEKVKEWSPRLVSKLEALLHVHDDFQLLRVNPLQFAKEKNLSEQESIDLFLHATKAGIFKMEWQVLCPHCGDTVESFEALSSVHPQYFCQLCHSEKKANLDDYIQVSFTVSPAIREIKYHHPENLTVEEFYFKYHFNQTARFPNGGPTFLEAGAKLLKALSYLEPGEKKKFEVETSGGAFVVHDLICNDGFLLPVQGEATSAPQNVSLALKNGKFSGLPSQVSPGKVLFEVENKMVSKESFFVLNMPPGYQQGNLEFDPFLTGNRLLTSQTFRDLYRSETIEGIGVKDLTLLFTDLKGSTALYERIGDLKAFSLVQQHFDRLGRAIQANNGAIVKTIGDAVMASFEKPMDAVKASLEMLSEIEDFNKEHGAKEIILKVGIHRGASIAVTLNERLDYFGQTVNIAARVQGLADAEEIYLTEEVFNSAGVLPLLKGFHTDSETAQLKGIQKTMQVFRVSHLPKAPKAPEAASRVKQPPAPPSSPVSPAASPASAAPLPIPVPFSMAPKDSKSNFLKNTGNLTATVMGVLVLILGNYYAWVYLPKQKAKESTQQKQLAEAQAKIADLQKQNEEFQKQKEALALPDCPFLYPMLDKSKKSTPLGSYLSYLAMSQASNLPQPVMKLPDTWSIFNAAGMFDDNPASPSSYGPDLASHFNGKDSGQGRWYKTSDGYEFSLKFSGSKPSKTFHKTFGKKGLHLVPGWMASCLLEWNGLQLTPDQKAQLDKPLYSTDEDLKQAVQQKTALPTPAGANPTQAASKPN